METQPFRSDRIGVALSQLGVRFYSGDGGYMAKFGSSGSPTAEIAFTAEGEDQSILVVRSIISERFDPDTFPMLLGILNAWNDTRRFPKVYLSCEHGLVIAESQVPLAEGIHDEGLGGFLGFSVSTINKFHAWFSEARSALPTKADVDNLDFAELEERFRAVS